MSNNKLLSKFINVSLSDNQISITTGVQNFRRKDKNKIYSNLRNLF